MFSWEGIDFKGGNDQNVKLLRCGVSASGGFQIFAPDGAHLGTTYPGAVVANCAWGSDGSALYIAAKNAIYRIRLNTKGTGF